MRSTLLPILALLLVTGCPESEPSDDDAGPSSDAGAVMDAGQQAAPDAGSGDGPDSGLPDAGTGEDGQDAGTAGGPDAGTDAGLPPPADAGNGTLDAGELLPQCPANACPTYALCQSNSGRCECLPWFVASAGQCLPVPPGDPATRTTLQVCEAWRQGHLQAEQGMGFSVSTATCDPGTVSQQALVDTLRRLNMHRYLAGVGPTHDTATENAAAQMCAVLAASNPPTSSYQPTATCYSAEGATGSIRAWSMPSGPAAIDLLVQDTAQSQYGSRRWALSPPLAPVGFGLYEGGAGTYAEAVCMRVFSYSNPGPAPAVIPYPPAGPVPLDIALWAWTVQGTLPPTPRTVSVVRQSDGQSLAVTLEDLGRNYGNSQAVAIKRSGWIPEAGQTYRVTLTGASGAPLTYDLSPVDCP